MDEEKVPMKGHYLMYNKDILERVARVIKPEGELTDEDREKAKEYIENESK